MRVVLGGLESGIAVGSFCPFGDGGEGREGLGFGPGIGAGGGGGGEGVAEGAVGLEGAELAEGAEEGALGAGVVAGQALEGGCGGVGGEGIAVGGQVGFEAADASKIPGGEDRGCNILPHLPNYLKTIVPALNRSEFAVCKPDL